MNSINHDIFVSDDGTPGAETFQTAIEEDLVIVDSERGIITCRAYPKSFHLFTKTSLRLLSS
jgi:hypothetical protein